MKVSVIIPVYNASEIIGRTLDALLNQDYEDDYEIITVNDGSTDNTKKVIEKYQDRNKEINLINQKNAGPAAARNKGAENAKGEYLLFTDSDCVPNGNWISQMVSSLEKNSIVGVQGGYECLNEEFLMARFIQYEVEERYERMKGEEYIDFIGSYSAGYKRDIFLEAGGFDEEFKRASGEDPELSYRLDDEGYSMVFNPDAIVKHEHPSSLIKYIKMKIGRGYWGRLLYKKHPGRKKGQSYNSLFYFLKIPLTGILSISALIFLYPYPILSLISIIILFLMFLKDSLNLAKKELKFLFFGPLLLYIKNLATAYGILKGYLEF